ncbi:Co2+/Mg2+ efflux protein ApaG [Alteromonadaceae bacterium M269]|nr:Co2+/Mg2+ efflux protein ApaG [Alteromonadaceae bacterium M269]
MSEPSVLITVETEYLPENTSSKEDKYAFAYCVSITNNGSSSIQLLSRYWLITDANGHKSEVYGDGVVGEQPHIKPGQKYRYVSGAMIDTPVGTMEGYYEMKNIDGSIFKSPIEVFSLFVPGSIH